MELKINVKNGESGQENGVKYNLFSTPKELKLEIEAKADSPEDLIDLLFGSEELKAYPEINGWREKMLDSISKSKEESNVFDECSYEDSSNQFEIYLIDDAENLYYAGLTLKRATGSVDTDIENSSASENEDGLELDIDKFTHSENTEENEAENESTESKNDSSEKEEPHSELKINLEFKKLIPPLSNEEYDQLKENIKNEGVRDPITIWNNTILDGHNRYEIAKELNVPFKTVEKNFANSDEAKIWVIKNQLGRRNLIPAQRVKLALVANEILQNKAKERSLANLKKNTDTDNCLYPKTEEEFQISNKDKRQEERQNTTNYQLGRIAGVSDKTIERYKKIQEYPEIQKKVDAGEISISRGYNQAKNKATKNDADVKNAQSVSDTNEKAILQVSSKIEYTASEPCKLLITAPPNKDNVEDMKNFANEWLPEALSHVKEDGFAYVIIGSDPNELKAYLNVNIDQTVMNFSQILVIADKKYKSENVNEIYEKNGRFCLFYRGHNAAHLSFKDNNNKQKFMVQNYDDILEKIKIFIEHSTQEGDIIFDPFAGEGKFIIAAAKCGRKAYGCESDQSKAEIAFKEGCVSRS